MIVRDRTVFRCKRGPPRDAINSVGPVHGHDPNPSSARNASRVMRAAFAQLHATWRREPDGVKDDVIDQAP
jgi:hypothetical protein